MNTKNLKKTCYNKFRRKSLIVLLFFSMVLEAQLSLAKTQKDQEIVSVAYISGWKYANMDVQGAIQFKLDDGWKTYWRKPGMFGISPIIDWSQSKNIKSIKFSWPTPQIFNQNNVQIIGYEGVLTIPIKIKKIVPDNNAILNVTVDFGVCSDICLLKTVTVNSNLESESNTENLKVVTEALSRVPSKITDEIFSSANCSIDVNGSDLNLTYLIELFDKPNSEPFVIIDYYLSENYVENQTIKISDKNVLVSASLENIQRVEGAIERNRLIALLILDNTGFEIYGCD